MTKAVEQLIECLSAERGKRKVLESIVIDTLWMARRYAHGRSTYAPGMVNQSIDILLSMDIKIDLDGSTQKLYADDGNLGVWVQALGRFQKHNK